jgi:hypothetical protein
MPMEIVKAIPFEPVGCLAEFALRSSSRSLPRVFHRSALQGKTGSDAFLAPAERDGGR